MDTKRKKRKENKIYIYIYINGMHPILTILIMICRGGAIKLQYDI